MSSLDVLEITGRHDYSIHAFGSRTVRGQTLSMKNLSVSHIVYAELPSEAACCFHHCPGRCTTLPGASTKRSVLAPVLNEIIWDHRQLPQRSRQLRPHDRFAQDGTHLFAGGAPMTKQPHRKSAFPPDSLELPYELLAWSRPMMATEDVTGLEQYSHWFARWLVLCLPGDRDLQDAVCCAILIQAKSRAQRFVCRA